MNESTNCLTDIYTQLRIGDPIQSNGTISAIARVAGSAGATRPFFRLEGLFVAPIITNLANGCTLTYSGVIAHNEYLEIDCNSSLSGDMDDLDIETSVATFDTAYLDINHGGLFDLVPGLNILQVQGGQLGAIIYINFLNKYHN